MARVCRDVSLIKRDLPLELDWESARYTPASNDELYKLYRELEFKTLLNKLEPPATPQPVETEDVLEGKYESYTVGHRAVGLRAHRGAARRRRGAGAGRGGDARRRGRDLDRRRHGVRDPQVGAGDRVACGRRSRRCGEACRTWSPTTRRRSCASCASRRGCSATTRWSPRTCSTPAASSRTPTRSPASSRPRACSSPASSPTTRPRRPTRPACWRARRGPSWSGAASTRSTRTSSCRWSRCWPSSKARASRSTPRCCASWR